MMQCPVCRAPVLEGSLFCDECGASLLPDLPAASVTVRRGRLSIPAFHVHFDLEGPDRWVLGRGRTTTGDLARARFIDLSPFGAYQQGVSRKHALLEISHEGVVYLTDLGSTNGTWVDHIRLEPQRPYPLPPVARVRLGRLELQWQGLP